MQETVPDTAVDLDNNEAYSRTRKPNFSTTELNFMFDELAKVQDLMFGTPASVQMEAKRQVWEKISQEMTKKSWPERSWESLRRRWHDMQFQTKSLLKRLKAQGMRPSDCPEWCFYNQRVIELLGEDSPRLTSSTLHPTPYENEYSSSSNLDFSTCSDGRGNSINIMTLPAPPPLRDCNDCGPPPPKITRVESQRVVPAQTLRPASFPGNGYHIQAQPSQARPAGNSSSTVIELSDDEGANEGQGNPKTGNRKDAGSLSHLDRLKERFLREEHAESMKLLQLQQRVQFMKGEYLKAKTELVHFYKTQNTANGIHKLL